MIDPIGIQTGKEFGGQAVKPRSLVIRPVEIVSEEAVLRDEEIDVSPDPKCKHCFGRGHEGRDVVTGKIRPCRCVLKKINKLRLEGKLYVHSPRVDK